MSGMSVCPAFRHRLRSLWHQFFRTIALMEFVLKNPCQQLCSFSLAPCQRSYVCMSHGPGFGNFGKSSAHSSSEKSYWWNLSLKNPCQQLCIFSVAPCQWSYACPDGALPKLFPTLSPPRAISHGLLSVSPCPRYHLAPSQRSSPQAISHGFPSVHPVVASISLLSHGALPELFPAVSPPSTLSSLPSCSLPTELSPSYFPRLPLRPPRRCFGIASLAAK